MHCTRIARASRPFRRLSGVVLGPRTVSLNFSSLLASLALLAADDVALRAAFVSLIIARGIIDESFIFSNVFTLWLCKEFSLALSIIG